MAAIVVDLEQEEVVLDSVAKAIDKTSSDLKSLEGLRLEELNEEQIQVIAHSADFQTLHMRNVQIGRVVMGFHRFMKDHAPLVAAMRNIMRPARGSHKRTKVQTKSGVKEMTWGEYCLEFYGVGHDWVNRMLKGEHTQDTAEIEGQEPEVVDATEGLEQTVEPKQSKKDRQIEELSKAIGKLESEIESRDQQIADLLLKGAVQKHEAQAAEEEAVAGPPVTESEVDWNDDGFVFVMDYFSPIIEPSHFASELDRIIQHCNMQAHIKTVLVEESPAATEGL